jgi:hypothetical protein
MPGTANNVDRVIREIRDAEDVVWWNEVGVSFGMQRMSYGGMKSAAYVLEWPQDELRTYHMCELMLADQPSPLIESSALNNEMRVQGIMSI